MFPFPKRKKKSKVKCSETPVESKQKTVKSKKDIKEVAKPKPAKECKPCRWLSDEQLIKLRDSFKYQVIGKSPNCKLGLVGSRFELRNVAIVDLAASCGLRVGELMSIKFAQVADANNQVHNDLHIDKKQVKGKKENHDYTIVPQAKRSLEAYIKAQPFQFLSTDPLWFSQKSKRINTDHPQLIPAKANGFGAQLAKYMYACGMKDDNIRGFMSTHSMRKTYAKRLYEEFKDIHTVQKAMYHKSPAVTLAYMPWVSDEMRKQHQLAVAVDLDAIKAQKLKDNASLEEGPPLKKQKTQQDIKTTQASPST